MMAKQNKSYAVTGRGLGLMLLLPLLSWGQQPVIRNLPGGIPEPPPGVPGGAAAEEDPEEAADEIPESDGEPVKWILLSETEEDLREMIQAGPEGVAIQGLPLVEERGGEALQAALNRQIGRPLNDGTLQQIGREIHRYYIDENRPILLVHLLHRDPENGGVGFLVKEAVVGEVRAEGAQWFDGEKLARQVRLNPGGPIDRGILLKDIDWLNQNPFRHIDVVFKPGREAHSSDVVLKTTDRFPVRIYGGVENTGSESTGEWRGNLGVQWGNAFGLDQQVAYQFSSAFDNFDAQRVHALTWMIPLPWRHNLNWYFSYGDSFSTLGQEASFGGDSWQISPRYKIPLSSGLVGLTQELGLGFDFKRSNYAVRFDGERLPTNETDIAQFALEYATALTDRHGRTSGTLGFIYSPGGLTDQNDDEEFQNVDPRAESEYMYLTGSLRRTQWLGRGWSLMLSATGQHAPEVLLSTENLGIGGYSTVRGYEERILFGDTGVYGGTELRSPYLFLPRSEGMGPGLQALAFVDAGWVRQSEPSEEFEKDQHLLSAGFGLRMEWAPYASLRADLGFPLDSSDETLSDSARVHVGLVIGF